MEIAEMLSQASIAAILSILVSLFPIGAGLAYAVRPSEHRLAMLRPISLAGLFAGLGGMLLGFMNVLRGIWIHEAEVNLRIIAIGSAEAFVPLFVAFGSLTFAWLCVAIGYWRQSSASEPV
jgi:hypothetical protein